MTGAQLVFVPFFQQRLFSAQSLRRFSFKWTNIYLITRFSPFSFLRLMVVCKICISCYLFEKAKVRCSLFRIILIPSCVLTCDSRSLCAKLTNKRLSWMEHTMLKSTFVDLETSDVFNVPLTWTSLTSLWKLLESLIINRWSFSPCVNKHTFCTYFTPFETLSQTLRPAATGDKLI